MIDLAHFRASVADLALFAGMLLWGPRAPDTLWALSAHHACAAFLADATGGGSRAHLDQEGRVCRGRCPVALASGQSLVFYVPTCSIPVIH